MDGFHEIHISIDGARSDADRLEARRRLTAAPHDGFLEIWIDYSPYPSLCALVNGNRGWLMFLRHEGDAGFSSRNSRYTGPAGEVIEYQLGNGQVDAYPAAWAYERGEVFEALVTFALHRRVPDGIEWFNDSGDGKTPNDDL
jgi:hypothetical protein